MLASVSSATLKRLNRRDRSCFTSSLVYVWLAY